MPNWLRIQILDWKIKWPFVLYTFYICFIVFSSPSNGTILSAPNGFCRLQFFFFTFFSPYVYSCVYSCVFVCIFVDQFSQFISVYQRFDVIPWNRLCKTMSQTNNTNMPLSAFDYRNTRICYASCHRSLLSPSMFEWQIKQKYASNEQKKKNSE